MILYVIRHGQAVGNQEGRFLGQVNPPLTDKGRHQAEVMGKALTGRGIADIVASDLDRARTTAAIVGRVLGLDVRSTPELREVNHGMLDGWTAAEVASSAYGQARERDKYKYRPPGGESYVDIENRVVAGATLPPTDNRLVVTHLGPMRVLLRRLCGLSEQDATSAAIGHDAVLYLEHKGASWNGRLLRAGDLSE